MRVVMTKMQAKEEAEPAKSEGGDA